MVNIWNPILVLIFWYFVIYNVHDVRIFWWFVIYLVYDKYIFSEKVKLAYTWDMTWISKINMFVHGISSSYLFELSDKYFKMSYPIDISITNICIRDILGYLHSVPPLALGALGALQLLRTRVVTAFFAAPFTTVMRRSSVAATDRPQIKIGRAHV